MAKEHLNEIYAYIAQDSVNAARHVKKELIKLAGSLDEIFQKYSKSLLLLLFYAPQPTFFCFVCYIFFCFR